MHDLDRIQQEYGDSANEMEAEDVALAMEAAFSTENQEFEPSYQGEAEAYVSQDGEVLLDEADEMEFAAELLEVRDDEELEQFFGKLIRRVGSKARKFLNSSTGNALKGLLKGAVTTALPGVAGLGGAVSGLAKALGPNGEANASSLLGMEMEGLSPEDQEFESARQLVRLGTSAAHNAVRMPPRGDPRTVAASAFQSAARRYAPGMIRRASGGQGQNGYGQNGHRQSGRWYRSGNRVFLEGI